MIAGNLGPAHREPLPPFENRYPNRLESILGSVRTRSETLQYDVVTTATAYYVTFAKSQAYLNGNKRMSIILAGVFLAFNGYYLNSFDSLFADLTLVISRTSQETLEEIIELVCPIFEDIVVVDSVDL